MLIIFLIEQFLITYNHLQEGYKMKKIAVIVVAVAAVASMVLAVRSFLCKSDS